MPIKSPGRNKHLIVLGPDERERGGVAEVIRLIRKGGLDRRWPAIHIATYRAGTMTQKLTVGLTALLRFFKLVIQGDVGAVHSHTSHYGSFWRKSVFFFVAHLFRIPWILHMHGSEFVTFYESTSSLFRRKLIQFIFRHANCIIVLTRGWGQWVTENFVPHRILILPNAVVLIDIEHRLRHRSEILFLGNMEKRKGIASLLLAIATIKETTPNVLLWCCGDGDQSIIRHHIKALQIENNVQIMGWVDNPLKQSLLRRAGIFALPSHSEGLPLSMLEAMASELPVVVGAVGGIPDVITDGVEGFLIDPTDVGLLIDRLRRLVQDDDLRRRMGRAGRCKVAKDHSLQVVMQRLEEIYTDLGIQPKSQ